VGGGGSQERRPAGRRHRRLDEARVEAPRGGTYLLVLYLRRPVEAIIGSLGKKRLEQGYYVYVGSARRGLLSRLRRHASRSKTIRWHIDYLTTNPESSLLGAVILDSIGVECFVADRVRRRAEGLVKNFGSTDCRCPSHLFYFTSMERLREVLDRLRWRLSPLNRGVVEGGIVITEGTPR